MGKLIRLELQNFKSYKGHHVVHLGDSYFTSIIGPNGSGKSNSMDAISFVLGIKSSHLRSAHLSDLVFRGRVLRTSLLPGELAPANDGDDDVALTPERNDPKLAWVMAVYEDDVGDEQRWKRTITNKGVSEYSINERVVSAAQYNEMLESENILIKARNFLVFQGDVEAIASQSPADLTKLIEQISGSLEHKIEYEKLKKQAEEALENQNYALNKRRGINSEIKQYSEQKSEADYFVQKTQAKDEAIVTHVLWKLFHFQQSISQSVADLRRQREELKEDTRNFDRAQRALDEAKKTEARLSRDIARLEAQVKALDSEIDAQEATLLPIGEKIDITQKNVDRCKARSHEVSKEKLKHTEVLARLRKDLQQVTKAKDRFEADMQQSATKNGRALSDSDRIEYDKLRDAVSMEVSANQGEIDALTRQQKGDQETASNLRSKIESLERKSHRLSEDIAEIRNSQKDEDGKVKQNSEILNAKRKTYNERSSERLRTQQLRTEKDEKLQEVLKKLLEAEDGRQQSEKELQLKATISDMKRIFPGIKGRVSELCKPVEKRYQTAMSTILGRNFDAVIVDKEKTAVECIQYLREQRRGQATFIPVDTIQASSQPVGHMRGCRSALDTIKFDAALERAFSYVCGNAVVCDNLEIAKSVAWDKRQDVKAVTLDGSIIHKGGNMTGGQGRRNAGRRFDDAEVDDLRRLQERLVSELAALPDIRRGASEDASLAAEINALELKVTALQEEIAVFERNQISKAKELTHFQQELASLQPQARTQVEENNAMENKIEGLRQNVNAVQDRVFRDFCKRQKIANIRLYEASQGSFQQELTQKRLEFTRQIGKLESRIAFEEQQEREIGKRLDALAKREDQGRNSLEEMVAEQQVQQNDLDVLEAKMEQLEERLAKGKEGRESHLAKSAEQKRLHQQQNKKVEETSKQISNVEAERQLLLSKRFALFRRCKLENLRLPLENNSESLDALPLDDVLTRGSEEGNTTDEEYGIVVDFDSLEEELRMSGSDATENRLLERIKTLSQELESMAPNMRAIERLGMVQERLRATDREFEDARSSAKQARDGFQAIKKTRFELFNKAFTHISDQIGPIYKNLTRDATLPMGGQAWVESGSETLLTISYLDVEDGDEPYLEGIKYHAMPPLKRFRDMEHLSGGEKTMAALALLFAIHSYQPSPFFVLDEVDAALDHANVSKIANYIRDHAGPGMQFIVISLKTGLFHNSEALVGVYRDQSANSSKVLTLDLRKYV